MRLVLLGKPMSGKGTQAHILAKKLKLVHLSIGALLRKEVENKTALGLRAKKYMDQGKLIPTKDVVLAYKRYLSPDGFILDGAPRTVPEAKILETLSEIDIVIDLCVSDALIKNRVLSRRMCRACDVIFGLDNPPKVKGKCSSCGKRLYKRADDTLAIISTRLKEYEKKTQAVVEYYRKKNLLVVVDGEQKIAKITKDILRAIKKRK